MQICLVALPTAAVAQPAAPKACEDSFLGKDLYAKVVAQKFAAVASPERGPTLGNFATVDLKEAAYGFGFANTSGLLAVKVRGGYSDGLLNLWSGGKVTPEVGIDVQYHHLLPKKQIAYDVAPRRKYCLDSIAAEGIHAQAVIETDPTYLRKSWELQGIRLDEKIAKTTAEIAAAPAGTVGEQLRKDSMIVQLAVHTQRKLEYVRLS
jgi:hypothetical protein